MPLFLPASVSTFTPTSTDTLQNKTIDNTNSATLKDTLFTLQDDGDTTKQLRLQLSGITTGTTRTLTVPDANTTIVGTDTTQTLTNKTLTGNTAVNLISGAGTLTINTTGTVTVPNTTDTLVGKNTTDTLTNKTLNTGSSTFTGLDIFNTWNVGLTCTVAANALTIALKGADGNALSATNVAMFGFRSTTLTTGTITQVSTIGAITLVISSGSTLGHASGVNHPIYVYVINNAGTIELVAASCLFHENQLYSTTAEGGAGAADSIRALYSTTARTGVAAKLIGMLISNQTTAGTWAAVPTTVAVGNYGTIAPLEDVSMRYEDTGGQSLANGPTQIAFATKDYDSKNSMASNVYTIPLTGKYRIKGRVHFSGTVNTGQQVSLHAYINATTTYFLAQMTNDNANTRNYSLNGDVTLNLVGGDTVQLRFQTDTAQNQIFNTTAHYNYFEIRKVLVGS